MAIELAALDLWNLFMNYVFGGFLLSIVGIALLLFIILGPLGRVSIYSTLWYMAMFIEVMAIGAGLWIISLPVTFGLLIAAFFSWKGYFER